MDDAFVRNYIEELLRNIRTQVVLKVIRPYTQVTIAFLAKVRPVGLGSPHRVGRALTRGAMLLRAHPPSTHRQELNIAAAEVEPLLVSLILDGRIDGLIDQVHQRLELTKPYGRSPRRRAAAPCSSIPHRETSVAPPAPRPSLSLPVPLPRRTENAKLYTAADRWTRQLERITTAVTNRIVA